MNLYTIGYAEKSAETFFGLLKDKGAKVVIDIRIIPNSPSSGYAKKDDLPYLLSELVNGCGYIHNTDLAPTKEILERIRETKDWPAYVGQFEQLMDERNIPDNLSKADFEDACLMCYEATPEHCHRRLVAERLANHWPDIEIVHL